MTSYKENKVYRYEFRRNGKRYRQSGYKTLRECRRAEADRKRDVEENRTTPAGMAFKAAANLYLDMAQRRYTEKTYKQKVFVLKNFARHTGNFDVHEIIAHHLHSYLNTRPTNNNYNAHRKDLCSFFSFARKNLKLITYNPCWDLDKMPHTPAEKYIPPETDILKLVAAADPKTDEKDLILTLLYTAARIDEILRLKWQGVNLTRRAMTRYTRKRSGGAYEPIICHMNDDLYHIMKKRWKTRQNETWVFYNQQTSDRYYHRPKLMKGLCKRAKIDQPFGFANIRHFVATYLADNEKISKKTIGGLLGHKALQTTEIYLHSVDSSEQDALSRLNKRFGS